MNQLKRITSIILFLLPLSAMAHNLGVYGATWSIEEVNLKTLIEQQAKQVNWNKLGNKLKSQAKSWASNLPVNKLPLAQSTKTIYVDPSVALNRNIVVQGHLLYRKGTWVNPLMVARPTTDMLFFNAKSSAQVKFALAALKKHPYKLQLVITDGNPVKLSNKIHRPVFYAFKNITHRFGITKVPSLLGVGQGKHYYRLAVTQFASPYHEQLVQQCWHGCNNLNKKEVGKSS